MKELNTYNRVAGYLNKVFNLINREYFDSNLEMPTILSSKNRMIYRFLLRISSSVYTQQKLPKMYIMRLKLIA